MIALHAMSAASNSLNTSLERLATGYRINTGADDPAGLIASEYLRAESAMTESQIANAQRADQVLSTAEGALNEVSNLLISLQGLVGSIANLAGESSEERDAQQLQIDSILSTINRIGGVTSFEGINLFDGHLGFSTSAVDTGKLAGMDVTRAISAQLPVHIETLASAQRGELAMIGSSTGLAGAATLTVRGNNGSVTLSFASATRSSAIALAVRQFASQTGVDAMLSTDNQSIRLFSTGYGASQYVSVESSLNSFRPRYEGASERTVAYGQNGLLNVNGSAVVTNGLSVRLHTEAVEADFELTDAMNVKGATTIFGVVGGGAHFGISSPGGTLGDAPIGLPELTTLNLGRVTQGTKVYTLNDLGSSAGGSLAANDPTTAHHIVEQAIRNVSLYRGRIGAYQTNVLGSTIRSLQIKLENLSSADSNIRETDYAAETANLARSQILYQTATNALSIANQQPQMILKLLGG